MKRLGVKRPLVWVACPPAVDAALSLPRAGLVYQRTDRFENFHNVDSRYIAACDRRLKTQADATLFCSTLLFEQEQEGCRNAVFCDHGVDFERFADAGRGNRPEPADVAAIPRPRVGFVGGIDAHTFDPPLFLDVAQRMTDVSFVLVGGCSLPDEWCRLPNVHRLGRREYDDVPGYMAACDVLIMPWNDSEWIEACNPVKLKEYLAVGRPVVSTPFPELTHYEGFVRVARDAEAFERAVRDALASPDDPERLRDRVRAATWADRGRSLLAALAERGLRPVHDTGADA